MSANMMRAMMYPVFAALFIIVFAGGLGIIFMILFGTPIYGAVEEDHHGNANGELLVVILGLIITVGVPVVAYLLQKKYG